jgi:hypothetical protein
MTGPLIVMDLGGVLVRTVAHAQFAALAAMTGIPPDQWSAAADGLTDDLESGRIGFSSFAAELARRAGVLWLSLADIEDAWGLVIDRLDDKMAGSPRAFPPRNACSSPATPTPFTSRRSGVSLQRAGSMLRAPPRTRLATESPPKAFSEQSPRQMRVSGPARCSSTISP